MYSVSVNVVEFVVYDQLPDCEETETVNLTQPIQTLQLKKLHTYTGVK